MEVGPVLVFLSFQRNEIAGLPLEGLKKMIRFRVFDIAAKIPKKIYSLIRTEKKTIKILDLLLVCQEVNG